MKTKLALIIILAAAIGISLGLGSFTFIYGKGYSYFANDPKACVNCHIMRDQYNSWQRSSHSSVTTCNSCHLPENFFMKYFIKAENGFNHAWKFTLEDFNDPIRIRPHNFNIAMNACLKCHGSLMNSLNHEKALLEGQACVKCHKDVGHTH